MSKPRSKLINYRDVVYRQVRGFTTEVHFGRQRKHLANSRGYIAGKSIISLDIVETQRLVSEFAGSGFWYAKHKERVDFGTVIGYYVAPDTGRKYPTTIGAIHYSVNGCHVVPLSPRNS